MIIIIIIIIVFKSVASAIIKTSLEEEVDFNSLFKKESLFCFAFFPFLCLTIFNFFLARKKKERKKTSKRKRKKKAG